MRLMITRPRRDALILADTLQRMGHEPLIEPLLDIRFGDARIDAGHYRAVLATSANGIRGLMRLDAFDQLRRLPLFAVGPATAQQGVEAGFARIQTAGGDVDKLAAFVCENLAPGPAPLLHASGAAAAGDLKAALETRGFQVERITLYEAVEAEAFSPPAKEFLRRPGGILLYSPRTAAVFMRLAAQMSSLSPDLRFFCLSEAVARKL